LRGDSSLNEWVDQDIHEIDRVLEHAILSEDVTVFRGVDARYARELEKLALQVDDVIEDAAYLSTSRAMACARRFMRHEPGGMLLKIRIPKGANALDMTPFSQNPEEEEILLPRGAMLRVTGYMAKEDMLELEVQAND